MVKFWQQTYHHWSILVFYSKKKKIIFSQEIDTCVDVKYVNINEQLWAFQHIQPKMSFSKYIQWLEVSVDYTSPNKQAPFHIITWIKILSTPGVYLNVLNMKCIELQTWKWCYPMIVTYHKIWTKMWIEWYLGKSEAFHFVYIFLLSYLEELMLTLYAYGIPTMSWIKLITNGTENLNVMATIEIQRIHSNLTFPIMDGIILLSLNGLWF